MLQQIAITIATALNYTIQVMDMLPLAIPLLDITATQDMGCTQTDMVSIQEDHIINVLVSVDTGLEKPLDVVRSSIPFEV